MSNPKIYISTIPLYDAYLKDAFRRCRVAIANGVEIEEVEVEFSPEVQEEVARRAEAVRQINHRQEVARLQGFWCAPKRHEQRITSESKEWSAAFRSLLNLLGSGMLIGLVGGRGTGKTQLAVELMRATTEKEHSALFCSAMQFFIEVKSTYGDAAKTDEMAVLQKYQSPRLLVIDEVGKRGGSDWENNLLFELINRRYNNEQDTILIDNRTKQEFIETIGPSLASRMNECGGIVECNWKSFRL